MTWTYYRFNPESNVALVAEVELLNGLKKLSPEQARTALTAIYHDDGDNSPRYPVLIYNDSPGPGAATQDLPQDWERLQFNFIKGYEAIIGAVCDVLNGKPLQTSEQTVTLSSSQASLAKVVTYYPPLTPSAHLVVYYPKFSQQTSPPSQPPLNTGDVIALQAASGQYLSRTYQANVDKETWVEANKPSIDASCRFMVTNLGNGQIALTADTGRYLYRGSPGSGNSLAWGKSDIDETCRFTVIFLDKDHIALKADTGMYFNWIPDTPQGTAYQGLEAITSSVAPNSRLKLTRL